MIIFIKSHIDQYTRKDGAVVQAHDDNRQAAPVPHEGVGRLPAAKREQYMAAHQQHHEITTQHMPNIKREMDEHDKTYAMEADLHAKHHALANEAVKNGDNDEAVKNGTLAFEASMRSFKAAAKHKHASAAYEKHAKRAEALHQKKEKLLPSA